MLQNENRKVPTYLSPAIRWLETPKSDPRFPMKKYDLWKNKKILKPISIPNSKYFSLCKI